MWEHYSEQKEAEARAAAAANAAAEEEPIPDAQKQVSELEIVETGDENRLFAGWMIASAPALSALEHPRYDIWVIRCTTS